ncbi:MAG TPA: class I adenylate-forming enzyme family protein [Caulobacteraceae bacterium]|nr:class I adenylate-forming enzyme family protein [Caulobacteraceae bacterium]
MSETDEMTATRPLDRDEVLAELTGPGQSHELERVVVVETPVRAFKNAPRSLRELFADTRGDAELIVYENERRTFAEAHRDACRIAALLARDYGVGKGDRVGISMRNFPEWILAFTAVTSLGAIAVAMNALWRPEEMEYGLKDSGAKVLFADQERLDRLAECSADLDIQVIAVRPTHADSRELWGLLDGIEAAEMPAADVAPDDPATIFYTSGSTGRPKGVVSSHRNILSALMSWELDGLVATRMMGVEPEPPAVQPATLLAVPLFHVTGSHAVYLSSYRAQRKIVAMYRWDPVEAAGLIEREKITSFVAPAAMTGDLVRIARQTERDLSTLMTVGGGGAPRAPEQVKQIEASFAKALPNTGWGMTETNAIGTGIGGLTYLQRPASSGRSSAVLDLKVIDDKGTLLPAGERGELLVRGTSVFRGYWNRPEVDDEVFVDGWFRTGDVAFLDDEGFLFIVDRIKDLIIRGGENIGCGQVEAALLRHPDVHEAAVYAMPDERLGEEVGTTIFASPTLDVEALRGFLGEHLARFEVPRYIRVSTEPLPRTASGKILKRELREEALAAMAGSAIKA